ncbi:hypothetical protein LRS74_19440 [Streptomyces sp. LX-29]|uniref:hypothetical protein n=1 Tax=Streptomyces sp. LX-29 TaxID=2900152 RepID=UPI00240E2674|nr:hypothetical protein [Streptomyces sp. LX-29]WFB08973.1 hypothetical protein LRS74_19440 [Streptomyces sp. LX-29]
MTLTYQDVVTVKLDPLTTAAGKWDEMAGKFKSVEDLYKQKVQTVSDDGGWLGVAAGGASAQFRATQGQLAAAQTQAKAIASLLRDAHTQFTTLVKAVKDLVADAKKEHFLVDSQGKVTYDWSLIDESDKKDTDYESWRQKTVAAETKWTDAIKKAVQHVDDADQGAKLALRESAGIRALDDITLGGHDFNGQAKGDIEIYEARKAKEYADKVLDGDKLSDTERAEWERLNRDNADDKVFSQTFLTSLGPEDTLKLGNKFNDLAYYDDTGHKKDYLALEKGLATTIAGATRVPDFAGADGKKLAYGTKAYQDAFEKWSASGDAKFYNDWREGLKKAGVDAYDLKVAGEERGPGFKGRDQQVRGYQSLITLMKQGDGYSPQFLSDVTDDMIAAEKKDQNIWDLYGEFEGKKDGWFANDPVDGSLEIMSRDPQLSTAYLDPATDGAKDRLTYLMKDRDWNLSNTTDWRGNFEYTGSDTHEKDARTGLGLAIEAGTTGREPHTPGGDAGRHSEAQARIMHDAINLLDYGHPDGKDGKDDRVANGDNVLKGDDYAGFRGSFARALSDYTPDTVDILQGDGPGDRVGKNDSHSAGDDSQIQNSRSSVLRMMRGVSEDDENYLLLRRSAQGYMAEQLATGDLHTISSVENRSAKVGEVFGALNAIGGDIDLSERDTKLAEAGDKRVYGYHLVGGMVTGIPVVGDMAQRTVDGIANEWLKGVSSEQGLLARDKLSAGNDAAEDALDAYFASWGKEDHRSTDEIGAAQREAKEAYTSGRENAYDALRERK